MKSGRRKTKDSLEVIQAVHSDDSYDTPVSVAWRAIETLKDMVNGGESRILDAGSGNFAPFGWSISKLWPAATIYGIDIRDVPRRDFYRLEYRESFLTWQFPVRPDIVTGNPPFSLAEEWVWKSKEVLPKYGLTWLLLKIDFLSSVGRWKNLYRNYPPRYVYQLPKRPTWWLYRRPETRTEDDKKKTNSFNYAFFLWINDGRVDEPVVRSIEWDYIDDVEDKFVKEIIHGNSTKGLGAG